jgi:alkylation response protein AidB-like acyl-CoA dehydrogenase
MIATITADQTDSAEALVEPMATAIRQMASQAEASRRLPNELVACLKQAGLFSIYTPKAFGGLDLTLPNALRVVEEVARHDGSTGWIVTLGVANSLFTSVLSRKRPRRACWAMAAC